MDKSPKLMFAIHQIRLWKKNEKNLQFQGISSEIADARIEI